MYVAWLCYPHTYELDDTSPIIKFVEPQSWEYDKIILIQFNPIHHWTDKDRALYV